MIGHLVGVAGGSGEGGKIFTLHRELRVFLLHYCECVKKIFATKKNTSFLLVLHKKIIRKYVTKRQGFQEIQVLNYVWKMKHLNHKYGKTFTITFNLKICCDFFRQTPAANFFCVLQFWKKFLFSSHLI